VTDRWAGGPDGRDGAGPPGLPLADPATVDLDANALQHLHERTMRFVPDVTSLLVARHGQLAFERYAQGGPSDARDTQSVTKSVLSLLTGIALDRGLFGSVDQPLASLLPDLGSVARDARWSVVTLRHLLTMTSGLPSELLDADYDEAWFTSDDPVRFALTQPLLDAPGTTFRYSNAGVHLLGAALARAAREPLLAFARRVLFAPLGIAPARWPTDPQGRPFASGSLHLTSRAMVRLGQLVMQRGRWGTEDIVPSAWIEQATRPAAHGYAWMEGFTDYGFLWWLSREDGVEGWYATGYGGQYVAVFPEVDVVVVMTGTVTQHASHRHVIREVLRDAVR